MSDPSLSFRQRLAVRLGGPGLREALTPLPGVAIDPDADLWRPLTARPAADLDAVQHDRMLAVSAYLDRRNPIARRLLDLIIQHLFAEGLALSSRNAAVGALLRAHWDDPVNDWDRRGPRLIRLLLRDGEVVAPASVNPVDGSVRWGTIPARAIADLEPDPVNWELTRAIRLHRQPDGSEPRLAVIQEDPLTGRLEGDALFASLADGDGARGVALLYPVADLIDLLDQSLFNEAEREQLAKAFIWDVTVQHADAATIQSLTTGAGQFAQPPRPGSNLVHNEAVSIQPLAPSLQLAESVMANKFRLGLILGALGIPEHWFGMGGDVNRAVGTVMADPTIKMLTAWQRVAIGIVTQALRFVVDQAVAHGTLPADVPVEDPDGNPTGEMVPARLAFVVDAPDMDPTDSLQVAGVLLQTTNALATAESEGLVSSTTARRALWLVLSQLGLAIDPDAEAAAIRAEQDQQAAATAQRLAPTPDQLARLDQAILQPPNGRRP